jgi:TolA-binding protein
MVKRTILLLLATLIAGGLPACKPNKQKLAAQAKAKALAEKKQRAIKFYQEVAKKYPESPYAKQAEERLRVLGPAATPGKKK